MSTTKKSSGSKKTTKKTTAKKVVKKTTKKTTKKAVKKTTNKTSKKEAKSLVRAKDKECFWTSDGKILKDLLELNEALNEMVDDVFAYHVTKEKNDFADWIETVLADKECSAALRKVRKSSSAQKVVARYLKLYHY